MQWKVTYRKNVRKQLKRIANRDRARIYAVLREMETDPFGGDIRKIQGETFTWRRRVGDWRIVFDAFPGPHIVDVQWILRRGSKTY